MRRDYRSDEAKAYRKLYGRKAWKDRRAMQLAEFPLCQWCEARGLTQAAEVVDHIIPHRGDIDLFLYGDVQSLCAQCHDSGKQRQETGGYDSACDLDGYPIDPGHPANR